MAESTSSPDNVIAVRPEHESGAANGKKVARFGADAKLEQAVIGSNADGVCPLSRCTSILHCESAGSMGFV